MRCWVSTIVLVASLAPCSALGAVSWPIARDCRFAGEGELIVATSGTTLQASPLHVPFQFRGFHCEGRTLIRFTTARGESVYCWERGRTTFESWHSGDSQAFEPHKVVDREFDFLFYPFGLSSIDTQLLLSATPSKDFAADHELDYVLSSACDAHSSQHTHHLVLTMQGDRITRIRQLSSCKNPDGTQSVVELMRVTLSDYDPAMGIPRTRVYSTSVGSGLPLTSTTVTARLTMRTLGPPPASPEAARAELVAGLTRTVLLEPLPARIARRFVAELAPNQRTWPLWVALGASALVWLATRTVRRRKLEA